MNQPESIALGGIAAIFVTPLATAAYFMAVNLIEARGHITGTELLATGMVTGVITGFFGILLSAFYLFAYALPAFLILFYLRWASVYSCVLVGVLPWAWFIGDGSDVLLMYWHSLVSSLAFWVFARHAVAERAAQGPAALSSLSWPVRGILMAAGLLVAVFLAWRFSDRIPESGPEPQIDAVSRALPDEDGTGATSSRNMPIEIRITGLDDATHGDAASGRARRAYRHEFSGRFLEPV